MDTKKVTYLKMVERYISRHNITDEDFKQDLYLSALEFDGKRTAFSCKLSRMKKEFNESEEKELPSGIDFTISTDTFNNSDFFMDFISDKLIEALASCLDKSYDTTEFTCKNIFDMSISYKGSLRMILITFMHFYLNISISDLAKMYGVSREIIYQVIKKCLRRLRLPSRSRKFRDMLEVLDEADAYYFLGTELTLEDKEGDDYDY